MNRIANFSELKKLNAELKLRSDENKNKVMIKIAMATCSIASGSKEVLDLFSEEMPKQAVGSIIKPTGCMGLCHSEPTVEVTLPGMKPVIFGRVNRERAKSIIENYIKNEKLIDGVIEVY